MRRNNVARWPSFDAGSSGRAPLSRRDTVGALTPNTSASSFCDVSPRRLEARTNALLRTAPARASTDGDASESDEVEDEEEDEDEPRRGAAG